MLNFFGDFPLLFKMQSEEEFISFCFSYIGMNRNRINALKSTRLYAPGSYSYYTKNQCYSLKIIQQNKKIIKRNKNMSQQMNVNKKFRRLVKNSFGYRQCKKQGLNVVMTHIQT